jgi:hypothetical protein
MKSRFFIVPERAITMKLRKENVIELSRKWLYMKILLLQFSGGGKSLVNLYAQCSFVLVVPKVSYKNFIARFSRLQTKWRKIKFNVVNSELKTF